MRKLRFRKTIWLALGYTSRQCWSELEIRTSEARLRLFSFQFGSLLPCPPELLQKCILPLQRPPHSSNLRQKVRNSKGWVAWVMTDPYYMHIPSFHPLQSHEACAVFEKIEAQRGRGTSASEKSEIHLTCSHQLRFVMGVKTTTIFPIKGSPASIFSMHLENTCMCILY